MFFPTFWSKLSACILKPCEAKLKAFSFDVDKYKLEAENAFSNNIYRDLTIDDLRREFDKTTTEQGDFQTLLEAGAVKKETQAVEYVLKK